MGRIQGVEREQMMLIPVSLDETLGEHPVRVIAELVKKVKFSSYELKEFNLYGGRPNYSPIDLITLLLYCYATGVSSSRRIEKMTYENIACMWTMKGEHPRYRTIARFRKDHSDLIQKLLTESIVFFYSNGLEFTGVSFTDGSKFYANAADGEFASEKKIDALYKKIEKWVKELFAEIANIEAEEDKRHGDTNKYLASKEKISELQNKLGNTVERIQKMEAKIEENGDMTNMTDKDAKFMRHSKTGIHTSYNAQISVDENRLIMASNVISNSSDNGQLTGQIEAVEKNTGKTVDIAVADGGYFNNRELNELNNKGKKVVCPTQSQVAKSRGKKKNKFTHDDFEYDEKNDSYTCPAGKKLKRKKTDKKNDIIYEVYAANENDCQNCHLKENCKRTHAKKRMLDIPHDDDAIKAHENMVEQNKRLLKQRSQTVELVFAHIKTIMKFTKFSTRGIDTVNNEWNWVATAYNFLKIIKKIANG